MGSSEPGHGPPAVLAAFEAAPLMLVMCTGSPLVVQAQNDRAREAFGDRAGQDLARALRGVDHRDLAARLEQVAASSETFTARAWPLTVAGSDGNEHEVLVDLVAHPFTPGDGEPAGVSMLAVDSTAAALAQQRDLVSTAQLRSPPQSELVTAMQDVLLPECLPVVPGVRLAATYLMADEGGGDWFDSYALDDGRVVLVVGDVVGRGTAAVGTMAELRVLIEEAVRPAGDLVAALQAVERRASRSLPARGATVCLVLLDPLTGAVEYCTAGHPPPLALRPGAGATYLPASPGRALGAGGRFAVERWQLDDDDALLLYSDGLLERSDRDPATSTVDLGARGVESLARLRADSSAEPLVDRLCADLLRRATAMGFEDDAVLLGAHRVPPPPELHLVLPADADALEDARTAVGQWLHEVPMSRLDQTVVQHTVGELVANVVEHAYLDPRHASGGDETCELLVRLLPSGSVEVDVTDRGVWRELDPERGRGRGLAMVEGFCDELVVERTPHGTKVCARHRPGRQAELLAGSPPAVPTTEARMHLADVDLQLTVTGVVDPRGADRLRRHLAHRTAGGARGVLLDLGGVALLGSAGVQVLVDAVVRGSDVRLLAPLGTPAQHVLDLVGLPYLTQRPDL